MDHGSDDEEEEGEGEKEKRSLAESHGADQLPIFNVSRCVSVIKQR